MRKAAVGERVRIVKGEGFYLVFVGFFGLKYT